MLAYFRSRYGLRQAYSLLSATEQKDYLTATGLPIVHPIEHILRDQKNGTVGCASIIAGERITYNPTEVISRSVLHGGLLTEGGNDDILREVAHVLA